MKHRYPPSAMASDYLVSGVGFGLSFLPIVMLELPTASLWILGLMSVCFAGYGLGAVRRHRIRVEVDKDGVRFSPPSRNIAWNEITRLGLAYFSTRRDGAHGWMELKIGSGTVTLRVDSRLERFNELVGCSWSAASRRGVTFDPVTCANLKALGIITEAPRSEDPT